MSAEAADVRARIAGTSEQRNARALELAKAHHAAIGPAWRAALEGSDQRPVVADWHSMPVLTQNVMVAVMRDLLDKGVIA